MSHVRYLGLLLVVAALVAAARVPALAGTTGGVAGHVVDAASGAGIADARLTAISPSQIASVTSDATGGYAFISLAPDTYVLTASAKGYDTAKVSGITVLADQTQTVPVRLTKTVATLGTINVRAGAELVKPGTTSDVYSINAAGQTAAQALGGPGGLNTAYSAMLSVPGVNIPQGQQGWYQTVYVRGGDQDQVGWELDGIPVNRAYDSAPMTMLSNIGQQELQVYTGGTNATADASGIAGYVNQVIKRGTYPGFGTLDFAIGGPAFYNKGSLEIGGATPGQRFSYYVATAAADTDYRYIDQKNGAGNGGYFYPLMIPTGPAFVYDGGPATFAPGNAYAIARTKDRETIANLHYELPRGGAGLVDDVQLLYLTSEIFTYYYSSISDLGGLGPVNGGSAIPWQDGIVYTGPVYAPVQSTATAWYRFPGSPPHALRSPLSPSQRDDNDNGVGIVKLQYQHNFSDRAYLRVAGWQMYSNWYIDGPLSAFLTFGAELADYELPLHQHGITASLADQLSDKHLVTLNGYFSRTKAQRYSTTGGFPNASATALIMNDVDANGKCYNSSGVQDFCYASANRGSMPGFPPGTTLLPVTTPYAPAPNTQWLITENGYHANLNRVSPVFSAISINDNWKPSDRLTFNLGLREETYRYELPDTAAGYPARAFWFAAYNNEFCFGPGMLAPQMKKAYGDTCSADFPGSSPTALVNQSGGAFSHTVWQPRVGVTYQGSANDVYRASAGLYARPAFSREQSWDTVQQDLPSFLGSNFYAYGFTTPQHDVRPDRSANYDFSWEHRFAGTDTSFKITPFYRSTRDQLQQFNVNALTGLFAALNVGHQISSGVEVALQHGSFAADGFAAQLTYTHTSSRIHYDNFANGHNVIDNLNTSIIGYNDYTSACAGSTAPQCTASGTPSTVAFPCFTAGVGHTGACAPGDVANPYFNQAPQPLMDRGAYYTPYDLIPAPFASANGYETPDVASVILNWRKDRFNISPSLTYSSGAKYGSPLVMPGYAPDTCSAIGATTTADTTTCGSSIFVPDPYTHKFDSLGDFKEPSRTTVNLQLGYKMSSAAKATLTMTGLVDSCKQRGYAWDYQNICVYAHLPSSILAPVGPGTQPGAFATSPPIQLQFPYAAWLNNNNTGFVGTKIPFQSTLSFEFKL